jgi:NitT/TauT family transport system substrate-binding protein
MRSRRPTPLLLLLVLLALLAGACGGGDSATSSASASKTPKTAVDVEETTTTSAPGAVAGETTTTTAAVAAASTPTTVALRGIASKVVPPTTAGGNSTKTTEAPKPVTLRLGYFPNVTHAGAIVAVEGGILQDALGANTLKTSLFNAGPAASEALLAGAIDATYIGPNPSISAYVKSKAVKIVSGGTSAGALFIVKPTINSAADLKGKKVASPQLGNTQDVALRYWLKDQGLKTDSSGGGDVAVVPQDNAQTLEQFKAGNIDGAWVPEPWATRLVQEGGGKVLLDERSLWPNGDFVTTNLLVRTDFLDAHPDVVAQLLEGQLRANKFIADKPAEAQKLANQGIEKATGKPLADKVIQAAWANMRFTLDPVPSSLKVGAEHAQEVGLLDKTDLTGIYDLRILNSLLKANGQKEVQGF